MKGDPMPDRRPRPLIWTREADDAYLRETTDAWANGDEYAAFLFGTIEPHALTVSRVLSTKASPEAFRATLEDVRKERLTLIGEARQLRAANDTAVDKPYVYVLSRTINRQHITICHSVTNGVVRTHPVGVRCDQDEPCPF
jgi:hypothetical protein